MGVTTGKRNLTEPEAFALLGQFGLPIVPHAAAPTAEDAVVVAERLGYPVALKVVSPDILHKTDVGGVALHLADGGAVRRAFADIQAKARAANPRADLRGVLVAQMAAAAPEVTIPDSAPESSASRFPAARCSSNISTKCCAAASTARRTSGSSREPLRYVHVPRALMKGLTPMRW